MAQVKIGHDTRLARARMAIACAIRDGDAEREAAARREYVRTRGRVLVEAGNELIADGKRLIASATEDRP